MKKQENKIAVTLSTENKSLIDYLNAKDIKASNAINLALSSYYKNDIQKAKEYQEKLKALKDELLSDNKPKVKTESKEQLAKEDVDYSSLTFENLKLATENEVNDQADLIVWLTKTDIKNYNENFDLLNAVKRSHRENYLSKKKVGTQQFAFIKRNDI